MNDTKTALKEGTLYLAYDRYVCTRCCGESALMTGYTIGGARVVKATRADAAYWQEAGLGVLVCECGSVTFGA